MNQSGVGSQIIAVIVALFSWVISQGQPRPTTTSSRPSVAGLCAAIPKAAKGFTNQNVTKLMLKDFRVGSGKKAVAGKTLVVQYVGRLANGTQFDTSCDKTPFEFDLGQTTVIQGWDQGIVGMKEGGIRRLIIPAKLGYGSNQVGGIIPPNSALVFDIELIDVK
jgi:FKBP-type peptidyl-prolyl cis-trans isomerase